MTPYFLCLVSPFQLLVLPFTDLLFLVRSLDHRPMGVIGGTCVTLNRTVRRWILDILTLGRAASPLYWPLGLFRFPAARTFAMQHPQYIGVRTRSRRVSGLARRVGFRRR
ncbi:uncharacterized protein C8Q71DRAFT_733628 [Rhodofomes roseus]|uniref:Secreted protein n=1 Tax=Rhodofomes roseus TaxID=34475 RepID=A0ABQ8KUT3_9APHY|nr:uncharacterized protein C8Q71DRAFT_733628 [Rhodofomes roseus]KAH9842607.1 hypothetical protein C8Q71DRAFT_733628 [Rhodofomes roseus]